MYNTNAFILSRINDIAYSGSNMLITCFGKIAHALILPYLQLLFSQALVLLWESLKRTKLIYFSCLNWRFNLFLIVSLPGNCPIWWAFFTRYNGQCTIINRVDRNRTAVCPVFSWFLSWCQHIYTQRLHRWFLAMHGYRKVSIVFNNFLIYLETFILCSSVCICSYIK